MEPVKFEFFTNKLEFGSLSKGQGKTDEKFYVRGYASTPDLDRQDELITWEALKKVEDHLVKNSTLFFDHNYGKPIGRVVKSKVDEVGLFIEAYISKTQPDIRTLIEEGILNRFSIGGRILEMEPAPDLGKEAARVLDLELFEVSLVGVPANAEAKVTDYIRKALKEAGKDTLSYKNPDIIEKLVVDVKEIDKYNKTAKDIALIKRNTISIDNFLGIPAYNQKVLTKNYPYFKMALVSKALKEITSSGWDITRVVDFTYSGSPTRPVYSFLETGRNKKEELLVNGFMFLKQGKSRLIVNIYPRMWDFATDIYYKSEDSELAVEYAKQFDTWMREHNFYKNQKITPKGHFLDYINTDFEMLQIPVDKKKAIKLGALEFFKKKETYLKNNIPFKRGFIFAGEPGTGKTLTGKVLMSNSDSTFIWVTADYFGRYADSSYFKYILDMAKELAPSIIFAEDIDNYLETSGAIDAIKGQMDGLDSNEGVVTILCTNYPENIPKALIDRPSRFDDIIKFDLPDEDLRYKILNIHAKNQNIVDRESILERIAKESDGLTGAHLKEVIIYSILLASDDNREDIIIDDLVKSLDKVKKTRELISSIGDKKKYVEEISVKKIPVIKKENEGEKVAKEKSQKKEEVKEEIKEENPGVKEVKEEKTEDLVTKTSEEEVGLVKKFNVKLDAILEAIKSLADALTTKKVEEETVEVKEEKKEEKPEEKKEEVVEDKKEDVVEEKKPEVKEEAATRKGVQAEEKEEDVDNEVVKKLEGKTLSQVINDETLFASLPEDIQEEVKKQYKLSMIK